MKYTQADYAAQFQCLAGACPDTCCKDWEIILDDAALARYRALPGGLGAQVRAALTTDAEGDTMFRLTDGHCPLLRDDGLCSIQRALGEEALCNTCHEHPRFYEEYGAIRELTLSISCPAAAQLLLKHEAPITFSSQEDGKPVTGCNDLDPDLFLAVYRARNTAIAIAQNRALPIPDRLSLELMLAVRLQTLLREKAYGRLERLLAEFSSERSRQRALAHAKRLRKRPNGFFPCWMILNNMEHLTAHFPRLLDSCAAKEFRHVFDSRFDLQWENLTVYFFWRYFLKASVDGRILSQVQSCVFHVLCIAALFQGLDEQSLETLLPLAGLYSKEVEHSEENLKLLLRVFDRQTISWKKLLSLLS